MENINKYKISNGINFNSIKLSQFKTGRISVTLFLPLSHEFTSKNAVLPFILTRSCFKYPDFTSLNQKLSDLYGANLYANVDRLGEMQMLNIGASFLDDRYALYGESISAEVTQLICESLFRPHLINNVFAEEDFEQEKRQLIELIDSEYNDKKFYARQRCEQIMCLNEKFSINPLGVKEQIAAMTASEAYNTWQNTLKSSIIEINMFGNCDSDSALNVFKQEFSTVKRENISDYATEIIEKAEKITEKTEKQDIAQSKLVMGFRSGQANIFATRLMVALFGGSPHSKLFLNVREKHSLCYYCSASYDRHKGIILVQSGVENKNIGMAKEEILRQLYEVREGNFTHDDISATKLYLSNHFVSISDSLSSLDSFYGSQAFDVKKYSPTKYAQELENITKEQIIQAANNVSLDTIYTLSS